MSDPDGHTPASNYFCHNCGRTNTTERTCPECQSEFVEEVPPTAQDTNSSSSLTNTNDLENRFNPSFDMRLFMNNVVLPMLLSGVQANPPQQRHRRSRPPRRIKRVAHRYIPLLYLSSFPMIHPGISPVQFFDINRLTAEERSTQFQRNVSVMPVPFQLILFDQNGEEFHPDMLTYEANGPVPLTREDINQLPTLTITPSRLSVTPSCAICLENFDVFSEVKQLPTCHHIFHTNCLTQWLLHHSNCPMCRTHISSTHQTALPVLNDPWLPLQTIEQQQIATTSVNTLVPYSPIKIINPPQTSSEFETSDQTSNDTLQLPRFDSQTH